VIVPDLNLLVYAYDSSSPHSLSGAEPVDLAVGCVGLRALVDERPGVCEPNDGRYSCRSR
jgi:hypothetical protein